jgi:exosome complex component RRP42
MEEEKGVNIEFDVLAAQVERALRKGERISKRKFDEYRKIEVRKNVSENAHGSAIAKIGETEVIAGVKFDIGIPYPDSPNEGGLVFGGEFLPLASPMFEVGPPGEGEIEWARVIDRGIRESHAIDVEALCLVSGEVALFIYVDLYTITNSGNLLDAGALAALLALQGAKIPKIEENKIVKGEFEGNLKLDAFPLLTTFAKIGDKIVLDPDLYEEKAQNARFSVGTTEKNKIVSIQKGYSGYFTLEEVDSMIDLALKKSKDLRKFVK